MPTKDDETVTASCGCVFCDLELKPEVVNGLPMHIVGDCDKYGTVQAVRCTRPVTSAVPMK